MVICYIVLGIACLLTVIGFVACNSYEARNGEKSSQALLENVQASMSVSKQNEAHQKKSSTFRNQIRGRC